MTSVHEWALAEAVISAVSKIAQQEGLKKVLEVDLRVGELQQVDLEVFRTALLEMAQQSLGETIFNMIIERAEFRCRACDNAWPFEYLSLDAEVKEAIHIIPEVAHAFVRCPKCGSPDFEIDKGRGIYVERVRGER